MKPYISYSQYFLKSINNNGIASDEFFWTGNYWKRLVQFENQGIGIGLRVHRYFGFEIEYANFEFDKSSKNADFFFINKDVIFYLPIFEELQSAVETYASVGLTDAFFNSSYATGQDHLTFKTSCGLQLRLFGVSSIKLGYDYYSGMKINGHGVDFSTVSLTYSLFLL